MILEILIALFFGILAGTFTGLAPGIHINLVALMLLISSTFFLHFTSSIVLACFIVSMAITHTFLDFITGIFLGAPEESTSLSILPGHQMLIEGRGYEAIRLTTIGCFYGLLLLIIIIPISVVFIPYIYGYIKIAIPYLLIFASLFLIIKENKKFLAFFLFMLSGILGIISLNFYVIRQPLFPLLTGLFGTSMLLNSINQKTRIPKQKITKVYLDRKETLKTVFAGILSSLSCSFMPGLGSSQAAVIGSEITGSKDRKNFLVLLGIIGILVTGLNFAALYVINKPRSGTSIVIGKLLHEITLQHLALFVIVALIAGSLSLFIALFFARIFSKSITKINYSRVSLVILFLLTGMCIFVSGWLSLIVLITATAIGIIAIESGIKKMHLMGCLIVPIILYFII